MTKERSLKLSMWFMLIIGILSSLIAGLAYYDIGIDYFCNMSMKQGSDILIYILSACICGWLYYAYKLSRLNKLNKKVD